MGKKDCQSDMWLTSLPIIEEEVDFEMDFLLTIIQVLSFFFLLIGFRKREQIGNGNFQNILKEKETSALYYS